jgi:hypothetical protein
MVRPGQFEASPDRRRASLHSSAISVTSCEQESAPRGDGMIMGFMTLLNVLKAAFILQQVAAQAGQQSFGISLDSSAALAAT